MASTHVYTTTGVWLSVVGRVVSEGLGGKSVLGLGIAGILTGNVRPRTCEVYHCYEPDDVEYQGSGS